MRIVLKFGGTSLSSAKQIRAVAKFVSSVSKKNEVAVVCSAVDDVTDQLLQISESIQKANKNAATSGMSKLAKQHIQIAKDSVSDPQIRKKLVSSLEVDLRELEGLLHGMMLLGEVTPR